jgi:hypothetical protein
MIYTYMAYGLILRLPFESTFVPLAPDGANPDVTVTEGVVPTKLSAPVIEEKSWQIEPGKFLLRGGRKAGRYLVEDGIHITLERNPEAEDARLAVHFFATVLPVLLQQRGFLVLHANTALTPHGAVAVSGNSGSGKTTTVAGLIRKGCYLLADDITVLRLKHDGQIEVVPGPPQLHMCEDTAKQFGYDIESIPRYPWRRMKAVVPVHSIMIAVPAQLTSIYLLTTDDREEMHIKVLSGVDKFDALQDCILGPLLPEEHFGYLPFFAAILENIKFYRISRPSHRWSLNEVVEAILHG